MRCCDPILPQARIRLICEPLALRSLVSLRTAFAMAKFLRLIALIWRKSSQSAPDLVRRTPTSGFQTSSTRQRLLWTMPRKAAAKLSLWLSERRVRPDRVVVLSPLLDDNLSFLQA